MVKRGVVCEQAHGEAGEIRMEAGCAPQIRTEFGWGKGRRIGRTQRQKLSKNSIVSMALGMLVAELLRASSVIFQPTMPSTVMAASVLNCWFRAAAISTRARSLPRAKAVGW